MYTNNAYLNNNTLDSSVKDKTKPLIVTSCGVNSTVLIKKTNLNI